MLTIIYRFLRWPAFVYYIIITRRRGRCIVFRPGRARVSKTKIFKRTRVRVFFFITVIICRTYPSRYDGPIRCRARVTDLENNNWNIKLNTRVRPRTRVATYTHTRPREQFVNVRAPERGTVTAVVAGHWRGGAGAGGDGVDDAKNRTTCHRAQGQTTTAPAG